jgi:hypothetical protein
VIILILSLHLYLKKSKMKRFYFLIFGCLIIMLQLICLYSVAQVKQSTKKDFVKFEAVVSFTDSEYVLIPKLTVSSPREKIQIFKEIYYTPGNFASAGNCHFFVQKIVRGRQLNIYTDFPPIAIAYPGLKPGYRDFKYGDILGDTIKLQKFYPLEVGKYRVMLQFSYSFKKNINLIETEWTEFEVLEIPRNEFGLQR